MDVSRKLSDVGMRLSAGEKRRAAVALECDEDTVRKYTTGKVAKLPFALKLLAELQKIQAAQPAVA